MEFAYQYSKAGCVGSIKSRCSPANLVSQCTFDYKVRERACAIANDTIAKLIQILRLYNPSIVTYHLPKMIVNT